MDKLHINIIVHNNIRFVDKALLINNSSDSVISLLFYSYMSTYT
nr:MAG TPA: hypothetical protein [Crassvirales sp.]